LSPDVAATPGREAEAMIDFTVETVLERPADEVFDYITDPAQLPNWQTNTVSSVPDGPMRVGTRLREVHRAPGGKELSSLVEVSDYVPGREFGLRVIEGTPVHLHVTLDPTENGTHMRFRAYGQLTGATRLLQPLLARVLRRQFVSQLTTLKAVLT
jgi:uncharacterized protein YndB with AHSA1/START domain